MQQASLKKYTGVNLQNSKNSNLPMAIFIDNIEDSISQCGAENILQELRSLQNQFAQTVQQFERFWQQTSSKIPEIENTIKIVEKIQHQEQEEFDVKFQLVSGVFLDATSQKNGCVILYLGAETYVEYPYDEALDLLKSNLLNAVENVKNYRKDAEFLKDQINVLQVNYSRVYNQAVEAQQKQNKT